MRGIEYQMKKIICLITAALLCLAAVGCGSKETEKKLADTSKEIVVILYDNDEYNSSVKDSFIENINKIYTASKLKISVKNAEGSDDKLSSITSKINVENTLLAVPIGVEASLAANKAFGGAVPIFFANVANPVLSGLMTDKTTPSTTTGIVSTVPANYIFNNFVQSIGSNSVGHVGIIFNTSEIEPMEITNDFKRYLDLNNYYYTETVVANTLEAQQAASKMVYKSSSGSSVIGDNTPDNAAAARKYQNKQGGANMLFLSGDSVVAGSINEIAQILNGSDYYVYVNEPKEIVGKNFVSLKPASASVGKNLADMVAKYLNGTSIKLLPCQTADEFDEFAYFDKNLNTTPENSNNQNGQNTENQTGSNTSQSQ